MQVNGEHADGVVASVRHFAGGAQLRPYRPSFQEFMHHTRHVLRVFMHHYRPLFQEFIEHNRPLS